MKFLSMKWPSNQLGMSFVELMIALTISVFLVGGVIQVYLSNKASYRFGEALSRVQENGRFSLDLLSRDIRMADYWGCAGSHGVVTNMLDVYDSQYSTDLHGFDNGIDGTTDANGSDRIVLRGAFDKGVEVINTPSGYASAIKVTPNNGFEKGDILIVSDCTNADIFQITNNNPDSGTVIHNAADHDNPVSVDPGNYNPVACNGAKPLDEQGVSSAGIAHCLSKKYGPGAKVLKVKNIEYFVATGASGEPALFRQEDGVAQELVEGVEQMQIVYGEDTDGDGTANRFVDIASAPNMDSVVSVRVSLLVRSQREKVINEDQQIAFNGANLTFTDGRVRQAFNSTVTIRNRAF
jgi:type IV pilus assembly protein PilW